MDDGMLVVGDVTLFIAAIGASVFAFSYALFFHWRKTSAGRALLYFVFALVVVFANNLLARTLGADYPAREWVRLAVYIGVAVTIWRLVFVLWRNWRADKPPLELDAKTRTESQTKETS